MNNLHKQNSKVICFTLFLVLSFFLGSQTRAQTFDMYLDYNIANFDDTYYVWRYNSLYTSTDTTINYVGLALDTLGGFTDLNDQAGSWTDFQYANNIEMFIDTIIIPLTHENNSGNNDIFRMKIVELNSNGTLSNNVLWQQEQFSNVSLSANGQWLGSTFELSFAPGYTVAPGSRVGLVFEYDDPSKLDTLGVIAGCLTNGQPQALQSEWRNSYLRYPPFINNVARNSDIGYGTPAGSGGWFEAQNWGFVVKVALTTILPPPVANFSLNATNICVGSCVTPTNSSTGSGVSYNWSFPGGNPSSSSSQNSGAICYSTPGTYPITLTVQNSSGVSTISDTITVTAPQFTLDVNCDASASGNVITICNEDLITFNALTSIPFSNVNYQWKKNNIDIGTNSPTLVLNNLQVGDIIRCEATSSNSCNIQSQNTITVGTVNTTNFAPDFTASQTNIIAPPFEVTFFNTTPNSLNYSFVWYYGDGTTSNSFAPTHTYPANGLYTVVLEAQSNTTGCKATITKPNYIVCTGSSQNCPQIVNVNPFGNLIACQGGTQELVATTNATNPSYQWLQNGVPIGGATQNIFLASVSASYSVIVYENGTCPVTSSQVSISFSNPTPAPPVITQTGQLLPCSQGSVTLTANAPGVASLEWNTGATSSSITINQAGNYIVTATYSNGCQNTASSVLVSPSFATNPGICLVTVDTLTNSNYIIWETPLTTDIDSFYIYKEGNQANNYIKIGAVDYLDLSEYNDINSNPNIQGYRYKLAVKDTCGGLTLLSSLHKTIHLQVFPGVSNNRQLSWSHYEGINFASYEIWRKLPTQQYQLLTTLPSNLNTYTDINPLSVDAIYRVDIVLPQMCNSVDRAAYGKSKSNVGNNQAILTGPDGLNDKENLLANLNLLPNPSDGNTMLQWESLKAQNLQIVVTDVVGKVVLADKINAQKGSNKFAIEVDAAGVYFVTLYDVNGSKNVLKMVVR